MLILMCSRHKVFTQIILLRFSNLTIINLTLLNIWFCNKCMKSIKFKKMKKEKIENQRSDLSSFWQVSIHFETPFLPSLSLLLLSAISLFQSDIYIYIWIFEELIFPLLWVELCKIYISCYLLHCRSHLAVQRTNTYLDINHAFFHFISYTNKSILSYDVG